MTVDTKISLQELLRNSPEIALYHQTEAGNKAHIVKLPEHLKDLTTPLAYITEAIVEGTEIEALCGYLWTPSKDPKKFPICDICKDIYWGLLAPDQKGLPDS